MLSRTTKPEYNSLADLNLACILYHRDAYGGTYDPT